MDKCKFCGKPESETGPLLRTIIDLNATVQYMIDKIQGKEAKRPKQIFICRNCVKRVLEKDSD